MILVIGGRSKIGSAVLDELVRRGASVRALLRSSEQSAFPPPIETVTGDLGDPASLEGAMHGVEQVFLLCGPRPDEVALNRNAIDAAGARGLLACGGGSSRSRPVQVALAHDGVWRCHQSRSRIQSMHA
jgi:uncharacterized protein YbjT (DUF2867 family)